MAVSRFGLSNIAGYKANNVNAWPKFSIGGTVTESGGYRIHTFTTVGQSTLSSLNLVSVEYLVIAGGGGATRGGHSAGGAGGYLTGTVKSPKTSEPIVVGSAGIAGTSAGGTNGTNGGNSSAFGIVSYGGGNWYSGVTPVGSGSGGAINFSGVVTGQSPTAGQGNAGGNSVAYASGGGGGAGAVGGNGVESPTRTGGNGGNGLASSISGSSQTYCGGGGGGTYYGSGNSSGGSGGGGAGSAQGVGSAATYYGGGGGAGGIEPVNVDKDGGAGYQGIVIIRYAI